MSYTNELLKIGRILLYYRMKYVHCLPRSAKFIHIHIISKDGKLYS